MDANGESAFATTTGREPGAVTVQQSATSPDVPQSCWPFGQQAICSASDAAVHAAAIVASMPATSSEANARRQRIIVCIVTAS
jgi:hypothetical protein